MSKIIVTGGSGFLGKHLCRQLLHNGHQVRSIDLRPNNEVDTVVADVRDVEVMNREIGSADCVFHLASLIEAGESVKNPRAFIDTNITGTLNVLEAMKANQVPLLIFSSSAAIYGEPQRVPIQEDDRSLPINPYGMTKLAMEGLLSSYVKAYDMTGVALRYFNLYGPEEHHLPETHAIPRFIDQISNDQLVTVWGDGGHQRDYVYIDDIVDAHLKALSYAQANPNQYHYFNLSTEQPASVLDIIHHLEQIMNKEAHVAHYADRPGDPRELWASATKAHQLLGWHAQVSLSAGLKKTVDYFRSVNDQHD